MTSREELSDASRLLESAYPEDILAWTYDAYGEEVALATGFGPSGIVLMHMASRVHPGATVFYLDTDLLFPETYDLKRSLEARLNLTFERVHSGLSLPSQAAAEGANLWRTNPDRCCFLRKVLPLRRFLADRPAWITGLRRDQSPTRAGIHIVEWDEVNDLPKVNPLACWRDSEVWDYIRLYDLPYNELHDRGYPSVGCIPCTKPVAVGEHPRAGRWRGHAKLECGIHDASVLQQAGNA